MSCISLSVINKPKLEVASNTWLLALLIRIREVPVSEIYFFIFYLFHDAIPVTNTYVE